MLRSHAEAEVIHDAVATGSLLAASKHDSGRRVMSVKQHDAGQAHVINHNTTRLYAASDGLVHGRCQLVLVCCR